MFYLIIFFLAIWLFFGQTGLVIVAGLSAAILLIFIAFFLIGAAFAILHEFMLMIHNAIVHGGEE